MASKKLRANKNATKGKQVRWKKGQSSVYNPKITKYRNAVKNRCKLGNRGINSRLTMAAIAAHDSQNGNVPMRGGPSNGDASSDGGRTFATAFTNCTNPTFNKMISNFEEHSILKREKIAVLAAIAEVIRSKNGTENDVEYFAALVTTLGVAERDVTRTAVASLLSSVMKKLPRVVLKKNLNSVGPNLKKLLDSYSSSEFQVLMKNLLLCLYFFIRGENAKNWHGAVAECYVGILKFTVHCKPRVRKTAHEAIYRLLNIYARKEKDRSSSHPAYTLTAKFCNQILEAYSITSSSVICYILNLLKNVMHLFPKNSLKLSCETILRFMNMKDPIVTVTCMNAINGMFTSNPVPENLPPSLNIKLIQALYEYEPNHRDTKTLIAWLCALESGFTNLNNANPILCLMHLPNFFKVAVPCFLNDSLSVHDAVASVMHNILTCCIIPGSPAFEQVMSEDIKENSFSKIFHYLEDTLSYKYHQAWKSTLMVLTTCFDVMGKHMHPVMTKCLQSLADLRESIRFPYLVELEKALGVAIHRMGPEVVLKAVPLMIDPNMDDLDFPRSWLLPLLRDNIKETKLGFFTEYFLPLVSQLKQKVVACEQANRRVEAKTLDVICSQIWSLLPSFCTSPVDLKESWKSIAKVLGMTLNEQPSLRIMILTSLRVLISKNKDDEENITEIARFAKNYLPILFNLYTTEPKDKGEEMIRLAVYESIKAYLSITEEELCKDFFLKSLQIFQDATLFSRQALLDILKAIVPRINEFELLQHLYDTCKPLLYDSNHTTQKKSLGVLQMICSRPNDNCTMFLDLNIEDIKSLLLDLQTKISPPSRALRLKSLLNLVDYLPVESKDFVVGIIPEATLGTKETASKPRSEAFQLLTGIGHALIRWRPEDQKGAFREYLQLLYAGFGGSPLMITATISSFGHIVYEFKDYIDEEIMTMLIENMCMLMASQSREIVAATISFLKTMFSLSTADRLAPYVVTLVNGLSSITTENKRALRFSARELLVKLVRKFSFDTMKQISSPELIKQLVNIRKMELRRTRLRELQAQARAQAAVPPPAAVVPPQPPRPRSDAIEDVLQESGDDDNDGAPVNMQLPGASKTLIEERPNEIVDLMDPSANKKIFAMGPPEEKTVDVKKAAAFEVAQDGRIVIPDDRAGPSTSKESEDGAGGTASSEKKRKREDSDDEGEDKNPIDANSKPVQKGIHRAFKKPKVPGAEYKAKKAGGDVKKGKLQPFSYIPLNKEALNKRKRQRLAGSFKGVVHPKGKKS